MDRHRDPQQIGYEWCAWYALQGDEPLECVGEAARDLELKLGKLAAGKLDPEEGAKVASSAHLFMIAVAELLDPEGTSQFKADISRRRKGKPINRQERALRGHRAARIVRTLEADGWKTEAAVQQAIEETGMSRAEVFAWHSRDKAVLAMTPEELATEGKSWMGPK